MRKKYEPTSRASQAVHFPGLHGLRFFAALAVVISHVELLKSHRGLPSLADNPAFYELGRIAVTFFFVLSGFLITYLLLQEKQNSGTVAIRKFYVRRILRIWPLYYLTVVIAFTIVSRIGGDTRPSLIMLFVLFLPQVALSLYPPVPYAEPLWSIGVEEQFYLFWPLLIGRVRNVLPIIIAIVIGGIAVKEIAIAYASTLRDPQQLTFWNHFIDYFYFNRFECMAIGALGAWVLFTRREKLLRILFSRAMQVIAFAASIYAIATTHGKPLLHYSWQSAAFCIVILNVAANERSLLKLRAPLFTFLGNISYAMYLLHEFAIGFVLRFVRDNDVLLYVASIALTIIASALVYRFFELPFLRLKDRFAVIESGATTTRDR